MTPELKKSLERWTKEYPYPIMGLVEALREVQEKELHVSPEAVEHLAGLFKTSVARVQSVATFFPTFTREKTGKYRVGLCHGLSCAMAGSSKMAECLRRKLDGNALFSWEEMECLGACDHAPALQVNDELKGKATEELVDKLVREAR